jgi:hypothetical protein
VPWRRTPSRDRHGRQHVGDAYFQSIGRPLSRHREVALSQRTLATRLIDHRQDAEPPAVEKPVIDEIYPPALVRSVRYRYRNTMWAHVLAPPNPRTQLQPVESIHAPNPLLVHRPALPSQHQVNALLAEPRSRTCDLPDPSPQRRLTLLSALPKETDPSEPCQTAGPHRRAT